MAGLLDPIKMDIPLTGEVSENAADLDAKISAELGIPIAPAASDDNAGDDDGTTDKPGDTEDDDATGGAADGEGSGSVGEESNETEGAESEEEPAEEQVAATPSDEELFIEVEDANGTTHKISKIEDLPEDFEPKSNRQGLEILSQLSKLEARMAEREVQQAQAAETKAVKDAETAQYKSWDSEVNELIKQGRLEKAGVAPNDPKYQEDPSVKRMDAVFGFMNKINTERAKAGNPNLITSFEDALDKLEVSEAKAKAENDKKRETDTAKRKASLIGGSSSSGASDFVYRSGAYKSIDDVPLS